MTSRDDGRDPCRPVREEDIYRHLAGMAERQQSGVLATVITAERSTPRGAGTKMIVMADGPLVGPGGGGAAEAGVIEAASEVLATGRCRRMELDLAGGVGVCGGRMEVFLEPVLAARPFTVVGAGHVGRALVEVGRTLPLRFRLVDDRADLLDAVPRAAGLLAEQAGPGTIGSVVEVDPRGAVLVASRGHELDVEYAHALLAAEQSAGREFGFFGVLGSSAKVLRIRQQLAERGHAAERLDRLQMPVGVDVGGGSPAEIAVSVLAEALAVLNGAGGVLDEAGRPLGLRLRRRRS